MEATPQQDIQQEDHRLDLVGGQKGLDIHVPSAQHQSCSDIEVVFAICTSDLII